MRNDGIRIGTRGSPLALKQTEIFLTQLKEAFPNDPRIQDALIKPIVTTGDRILDRPLAEVGGKGLFAKEIERALFAKEIDCAVHSLKDMETTLPPGLVLPAVLKREDPRDVLVSQGYTLETLPQTARVGTSSPRRAAFIKYYRPDVEVTLLRGNIATRLSKLEKGEYDAIILAAAGLKRLGLLTESMEFLPEDKILPAACQGIIALECREEDLDIQATLARLNHPDTWACAVAERSLLEELDGSCRTPIASHAKFTTDDELCLKGMILAPDGGHLIEDSLSGAPSEASALGKALGRNLKELAGDLYDLWRAQ